MSTILVTLMTFLIVCFSVTLSEACLLIKRPVTKHFQHSRFSDNHFMLEFELIHEHSLHVLQIIKSKCLQIILFEKVKYVLD